MDSAAQTSMQIQARSPQIQRREEPRYHQCLINPSDFNDNEEQVCAQLGEEAWQTAAEVGRAMSIDEAVEYGLEGLGQASWSCA